MRSKSLRVSGVVVAMIALSAYVSTRGEDGSLKVMLVAFAATAAVNCGSRYYVPHSSIKHFVGEMLLAQAVAAGAMLINAQLDEMAGMLYLFIPVMVVVIISVGGILTFVTRRAARVGHMSSR